MVKKVCVFAASSDKVDLDYKKNAGKTGKILAQNNISVVYGGGAVGLMGALANGALVENGEVIGVIPQFMVDMNWGYEKVSEMLVVDTMFQRKQKILEIADAAIALPGGIGTLDELLEVITLKQLGKYNKPIVILNSKGFFDHLINQLEKMIDENFMREQHRNIWKVVEQPEQIIPAINDSPGWANDAIFCAAVE